MARQTSAFFTAFQAELALVKRQFDFVRRKLAEPLRRPYYAGQAAIAQQLARRLNKIWAPLQVCQTLAAS